MGVSRKGNGPRALLRAGVAGLLALVILAHGAFAAGRASSADPVAAGTEFVEPAARPCADASGSTGSHQSPCSNVENCCIVCSAVALFGAAAGAATAPALPSPPPDVCAPARRRPSALDRRPPGWVTSWSAQAPPRS